MAAVMRDLTRSSSRKLDFGTVWRSRKTQSQVMHLRSWTRKEIGWGDLYGSNFLEISRSPIDIVDFGERTSSTFPLPLSLTLNGNDVSRPDLGSLRSRNA